MLPKGAAALLVKEMLISCDQAAASLVKRYANFTQGCGRPSWKDYLNFI
jgi:hypothetical protein